jgi:integrase
LAGPIPRHSATGLEVTVASIQDRWRRKDPITGRLVPTAQDGQGLRYRPQFRDPSGRQVAKSFALKRDAQRWLDEQTAHVARGTYVDPGAGRITFCEFYEDWSSRQVWAPGTVLAMKLAAGSVPFADVPLRSLRRSHIEGWIKGMVNRGLAPGTVHTRTNNVRAVLRGAVADRLIPSDPSIGVALPRRRRAQAAMTLPTAAQVGAVLTAADERFRPFVALCAFAGLRLGEAAGLRVEDIDFLRRTLTVARQVQRAGRGQVEIRPPKYGSERIVFLAPGLVEMLAAHIAAHRRTPTGERLDLHWRRRPATAPEHRRPPLAHRHGGCRCLRSAAARPPALLRLGSDRLRLRRRHRAARPWPRLGDHHAVDVFAPVAQR